MGRHHFVDTTQDYQKREAMRMVGYIIIVFLVIYGLLKIGTGGSIKTGLILIAIGVLFYYISRAGDKRSKKIASIKNGK